MTSNSKNNSRRAIWNNLIGNADDFSIENRAFNYVCIISFIFLVVCICFDIYICHSVMTYVLLGMLLVLSVLYYYSRYRKRYEWGAAVFAFFCYASLVINYFENSGSYGPTIFFFFVSFVLLLALSRPAFSGLWIGLHSILFVSLLVYEYCYPVAIPDTYPDRAARYLDLGACYIVSLVFIYAITRYLRDFYDKKVKQADERALAIEAQNKHISAQNIQLETINNEKNKLFSIISHDLKSPLDAIRGFLEMLSGNMLDEEERQKIQEDLLEQTKYTSDLLVNLMSWAKTQMHGVTVHLAPHNLKEFVDEVTYNKRSIAARKGIKLTFSIRPDIEVVCDRDMLHIVLRNLVNNAIKFTNPGGEVCIRVATDKGRAQLSVQDTGIGIPKEKQADLFTLKTRSTFGTAREKGIGLGLLMCKEYMDYQRGEIWFNSEEGEGTTFFISLPLTRF